MSISLDNFRSQVERAETLTGIAKYLEDSVTFDTSDIYRAVVVLIVSALDSYIHEIVLEKLPPVIADQTLQTDALLRFPISMKWVRPAQIDPTQATWAIEAVREQHCLLSFQRPDSIADALRLVSSTPIWPEVANILGKDVPTLKSELKLVVGRRNKIAHESDIDPTTRQLWPIDLSATESATSLIKAIVEALDTLL